MGTKMRYKVGDLVTFKSDLVVNKKYGQRRLSTELADWAGTTRKILRVETHSRDIEYVTDKSPGWYITEEMLVGLAQLYNGNTTKFQG